MKSAFPSLAHLKYCRIVPAFFRARARYRVLCRYHLSAEVFARASVAQQPTFQLKPGGAWSFTIWLD